MLQKTRSDLSCLCGNEKLDINNWVNILISCPSTYKTIQLPFKQWDDEYLAIYCCNQGPCQEETMGSQTIINCPHAKLTNVTEMCDGSCPAVSQSGSALGVSVKCSTPNKCLEEFHYVVKACYNTTQNYSPQKFAQLFCPYPYGRPCPEVKNAKYKYHECYDIQNWYKIGKIVKIEVIQYSCDFLQAWSISVPQQR